MIRTLAAWLVLAPATALAQNAAPPVTLPRADAAVTVGWFHSAIADAITGPVMFRRDDWAHDRATIGATLGIYWDGHLKTELTAETSSATHIWDAVPITVGDEVVHRSVEHAVRDTRFSIGQFYQFGRNQWVHPSAGAGLTVRRRARTAESFPAFLSGSPARGPRMIAPYERIGPEIDTQAAGFAALALKAYVTQRAFFRTDAQFDFRNGLEDVNARVGFGFDF